MGPRCAVAASSIDAPPGRVSVRALLVGSLLTVLLVLLLSGAAKADLVGHGGPVRAVAVSPNGARALTAGFDYSLILWDLASQRALARLIGHEAAVNAVAFLPDGRRAVSASDDGTVGLWDLEAERLVRRFEGHRGKVADVAVSPDGGLVASAGWDRTVRLWDPATGRERALFDGHANNVNAVAFTPDGARLVSGDYDATIRIWNVADGSLVRSVTGHDFGITCLAVMPGGHEIASASIDESVRLWDIASGAERAAYAQIGPVLALALSADGRLIAAGAADGAIRVFDAADRSLVHDMAGHGDPVWSLAFAPSGDMLLAAIGDSVELWDLAAGRKIAGPEANAVANRPLPDGGGRGAEMFRKCSACHSVTADDGGRAGPTLYRLFGRRAGALPGYPYSEALENSDIVWTERTVDRLFAQGPEVVAPGSKMPLQRMPSAQDRAALIDYLRRITAP